MGRFTLTTGSRHDGLGKYDGSGELCDCFGVDLLGQELQDMGHRVNNFMMDQMSCLIIWGRSGMTVGGR